jgi:hypothetical protein
LEWTEGRQLPALTPLSHFDFRKMSTFDFRGTAMEVTIDIIHDR